MAEELKLLKAEFYMNSELKSIINEQIRGQHNMLLRADYYCDKVHVSQPANFQEK